jgi:EmrB/QacA subfamily drug resistance transporter
MVTKLPDGGPPAGPNHDRLDPAFVRLAMILMTGTLAVVFDATIVSVALRTLSRDLKVPVSTIQWVTTGYLLALGIAVPVTGWLAGRFGGKRVWMAALTIFLLGSVASSLAWSAPALIAARVVQGAGGGLMLPVMQTLLIRAVGGRSLARATSLIALPPLLGPVFGPALGGLIIDDLSWRWIFWVNVPFCVAGLILAWRLMPADTGNRAQHLDVTGLLLLSPGIAVLLYGLSQIGATGGFGSMSVIVPLAAGSVLLAAFVLYALSAARPLLDLRLFRVSSFTVSTLLTFLSGFVLYGALLLMPLYFQDIQGHDPLRTGLLLAPQGIGILASRSMAGLLTDRIGPRWVVVAGLVLVAAGTVPFALAGVATSDWGLMAALIVRGAGLGGVTLPVFATAYQGLDRGQIADASIVVRTAQQVGGSFGSAVLAIILAGALAQHTAGPAAAFRGTFWWATAFSVVAVLLALWLPAGKPGDRGGTG